MAIALDASSPAEIRVAGTTATTETSASFSPPAGSLVVVEAGINFITNTPTGPTVTCADSGSTSYTAGPSAYDGAAEGAYLFSHFYATAPGSITVTVTRSVSTGTAGFFVKVRVLTGVAASQAGAASASNHATSGTSFTVSITPTQPGSWVIAAGAIGSNQAPVGFGGVAVDSTWQDAADGTAHVSGHSVTGSAGASTQGFTGTSVFWSVAALEVLPDGEIQGPEYVRMPPAWKPGRQPGMPGETPFDLQVPVFAQLPPDIIVIQRKVISGANSGSLDAPTSPGNALIVAYAGSAGAGSTGTCSTSSITIGGTSMAKQVEVDAPANASAGCAAVYLLGNLAGGQTAIVVTGTNLVAADGYIVAYEVSGLGPSPALDQSSTREDHTGVKAWSSDSGTAPTTSQANEFWVGIHAAGPNSGQPDTFTVTNPAWRNAAQFNWGSPGGASIAGHQVVTATGSLRYDGTAADFDFYVTAVASFSAASAVPISLAESGSADDSSFVVSAAVALAEAGSGADALSISSAVSLSETGTGTDTLAVNAAVALAEAGSAAETLVTSVLISMAEAGSAADSLTVAAAVALAESGSGADSLTVGAAVALSESGTGTDTLAVNAAVALADSGTGTDTLIAGVLTSLAESGSATESLTVSAAVALAEAGAGADTLSVAAAVSLAEAGTGTDTLTVAAAVSLSESGTGTDTLVAGVQTLMSDAGSAAESLAVTITAALAEAGSASESLTVAAAVSLSESGTGTDTLSVTAAVVLTEAATGTEALVVTRPVALTDAGSALDTLLAVAGATVHKATGLASVFNKNAGVANPATGRSGGSSVADPRDGTMSPAADRRDGSARVSDPREGSSGVS